jgi:hypothetical protein
MEPTTQTGSHGQGGETEKNGPRGRSCNGTSHMRRADANGRWARRVPGEGGSGVPGGQAPVSGSVPGHNRVAVGIRRGGVTQGRPRASANPGLGDRTPLALGWFGVGFARRCGFLSVALFVFLRSLRRTGVGFLGSCLSRAKNRPSTERVFCSNELAVCGSSTAFNACAG